MKRGIIIFLLFLLFSVIFIPYTNAQSNIIYDSRHEELDIEINISNEINQSENANVNLTLYVFPKNDYRQEIISKQLFDVNGNPIKLIENEYYAKFSSTPKEKIEYFVYVTKLKTRYYNPEIREKITLDELLKSIPLEIKEYSEYNNGDNIDFNDPFIRNKVLELKSNDDTLEILHNFAEYINKNMIYDLNVQDLKKASEIMQNKRGVCSHYTTLFMAFARSIGLPVKYITGMAYSNEEKKFREHAWAEVWLGEKYGWVPYDPTYREYGWIDAYHIKLKESHDSSTKAIEYQYTGEISPGKINIDTFILGAGNLKQLPLSFSIRPIIPETGMDSYVPLEIKAKIDYYLSLPVFLATAPGYFGSFEKTILLKPAQETIGYFLLYTPVTNQCEAGCISDIEVKDVFGNFAKSQLQFGKDKGIISLEEAQRIIPSIGALISNLDVFCKSEKNYYYDYEKARLLCIAENRESKERSIILCLNEMCQREDIIPDGSKQYYLEFDIISLFKNQTMTQPMSPMVKCVSVKEYGENIGTSCVNFVVLRTPEIKIESIENKRIKYDGKTRLSFNVSANTNIDLNLTLKNDDLKYIEKNTFWLKNGQQTVGFVIDSNKIKNLKPGIHEIKVLAVYTDKNNKEYYREEKFNLEIEDTNIINKFFVWIKRLFI